MMDPVLLVWNPMKLLGALVLLLLLLLPVPPAYSEDDYCTEKCLKRRDIYKHGREPFKIVCGEIFPDPSDVYYVECMEKVRDGCNNDEDYDDDFTYTVVNSGSFQCKGLYPPVKLDCPKWCEEIRRAGRYGKDPFSFSCQYRIGFQVDCTKCTEECPTVGGELEYECVFELEHYGKHSWGKHMIRCPDLREKPEKPDTAGPGGEATTSDPTTENVTTPVVVGEMTTASGSHKVAEQKTGGDDDDSNSTVYIIVGVVVGLLLLIAAGGVAYYFYRKWKMRREVAAAQPASEAVEPSIDESVSSVSSYSGEGPVKAIGKV